MVFTDKRIKDISEVNVRILITSIDTAMLVVEFNGTSNGLGQGEARGLGDNVAKLSPFGLSNVFSYQGVLGFDFWERCHAVEKKKFKFLISVKAVVFCLFLCKIVNIAMLEKCVFGSLMVKNHPSDYFANEEIV